MKNLKDIATIRDLPEAYAQPWALPATAVQAYPPVASEGTPGWLPAYPADPKSRFPQANRPPRPEVRTDGMAHETRHHAKTLPADLGAPAFVDGWKTRALMVGAVFSVIAVILGFLGQAQDGLGWDHFLRAWMLGTDAHLWLCRRRPGAAHGAVLLRRQVGPAAAAAP